MYLFSRFAIRNIASKAINYFTHSRQYGPILTGFSKPAAEISRGLMQVTSLALLLW